MCPRTVLQNAVWASLYKCVEPVLSSWPINKLRDRALKNLMEHIHYEDDNTQYLCICAVNKVKCVVCFLDHLPRCRGLISNSALMFFFAMFRL